MNGCATIEYNHSLNILKKHKMENKKSILAGSILAGALLAVAGINANASSLIRYNHVTSADEVIAGLHTKNVSNNNFELKCGATKKSDTTKTKKKGKDGKCGEGKCGSTKKSGN